MVNTTTQNSVLDNSKPFYKVELYDEQGILLSTWSPNIYVPDEKGQSTPFPNTYITSIETDSSFDPPTNNCVVRIRNKVGYVPPIKVGSVLKVYFGYYRKDKPTKPEYALVYTGTVDEVNSDIDETIVDCRSKIQLITTISKNLSYNVSTADKIIEKLAKDEGKLELESSGIDQTQISKSKFVLSNEMTLFEHIKRLSDEIGFDTYMSVNDKFVSKEWKPKVLSDSEALPEKIYQKVNNGSIDQFVHPFHFGLNVKNIRISWKSEDISKIECTSFANYGEETETMHTINPIKVSSNETAIGEKKREVYLPYTSKKDAETITKNLIERYNKGLVGEIEVIGSPQVRLGDAITLLGYIFGEAPLGSQLPVKRSKYEAKLSTEKTEESEISSLQKEITFQVTGVKHMLNMDEGFYSEFKIRQRKLPVAE